jgi:hypothetical protein
MEIGRTLYITNRKAWRAWLARNYARENEIWLIYYKKHTGKPRIPDDDAVEEALCYGWIDSIIKRVDDERNRATILAASAKKFSLRNEQGTRPSINQSEKDDTLWSEENSVAPRSEICRSASPART